MVRRYKRVWLESKVGLVALLLDLKIIYLLHFLLDCLDSGILHSSTKIGVRL